MSVFGPRREMTAEEARAYRAFTDDPESDLETILAVESAHGVTFE